MFLQFILLNNPSLQNIKKQVAFPCFNVHAYFFQRSIYSLVLSVPSQFLDDFIKTYQITKREVEILKMIAAGRTTKQISEHLFVSGFTINAHRRNICRKLNIYTPVGLVNFAREHGACII